ncbi:hypothetical protein [Paraburkholderia fungorum]|uniref:hypothetical protein n=1 Tax=Paraburkholderia fungorum TaxID=134537 RepID=UPI003313F600
MIGFQKIVVRDIEARGGKVFIFDKGTSIAPILSAHAQKKLTRVRRYGSRKVKVAVRRNGSRSPMSALAVIRAVMRQCT